MQFFCFIRSLFPYSFLIVIRQGLYSVKYLFKAVKLDGAMEMAQTIASNAPLAVHYCKVAMSRRVDRFLENDLDYEAQVFAECFETEDQRNAMTAFLEKRPKAEFKGE